MKRSFSALLFFALLLGAWHLLVVGGIWGRPAPMAVWEYLATAWRNDSLVPALLVTTQRLLLGYALGVLVGIPIGLLTARFQTLYDTVGVIGLGFQTLPSVCWVPLALLWFEPHVESAMLFVVVMGTLWSVALATNTGVRNVPPLYARAARTMGSEGLHLWFTVIVPAALPVILGGVKQGWAFAWRSLMAAEIYVTITGRTGLGKLLNAGRDARNMAQVIGVMVVIVIVGLLADKILFGPWERYLRRRWGR
jgi:NitT/TauT family transport system permease protein